MRSTRNRRLASLALLSAAIGVSPVAGSWLRGGASVIEEKDQNHRQELSLFSITRDSPAPTPNATESDSSDFLRLMYSPTPSPTATPHSDQPSVSPTLEATEAPSLSAVVGTTEYPTASPTVVATESTTTDSPTTTPSAPPVEDLTTSPTAAQSDSPSQVPTLVTITTGPGVSQPEEPEETAAVEEAEDEGVTAETEEEESSASDTAHDKEPEGPEETDAMEEAEDEDFVTEPPKPPTEAPTSSPTTATPSTATPTTSTLGPTSVVEASVNALKEAAEPLEGEAELETGKSYVDESWDDLPVNAKAAAMTLGYDRVSWDFRQPVFSDHLLWADLEPEQAMSATILGFDETSWNAKHVPIPEPLEAGVHDDGSGFSNAWNGNNEGTGITKDIANDSYRGKDEVDGSKEAEPATSDIQSDVAAPTPDYYSYDWADLPDLQKEAAKLLGYTRSSWNNDEDVVTSFMTWNQMSFDLRQAAKTLGLHQQSWNMAVAEREPPVEAETETTSTSFYSHTLAQELTAEVTKEKEVAVEEPDVEAKDPNTVDLSISRAERKKAREEAMAEKIPPVIEEIEREVDGLKVELADAREKLQKHEKVLDVLQHVDPDTTIGSIGDIIKLGRKKKGNGWRKKGRKKENDIERVAPVPPAPKVDVAEARFINNNNEKKNNQAKKNLMYEPEATKRTFFGGDEESAESEDSEEETTQTRTTGYGGGRNPATQTKKVWTRQRGAQ